MRFMQALRALLQTWQGVVLAVLAVVGAIYNGPRKVLETYYWYMEWLRDHKVSNFLRSSMIPPRLTAYGELAAKPIPKSLSEISAATGLSEKRTLGSLKRLQRKHSVAPDGDKWKAAT